MKSKKQRKMSVKAVKKVRFQVKQALVKRADVKNFKPTVAQAQSWFNILNKGIFNSRLTMPEMELRRLKDCWGQCFCIWDARKVKSVNERALPVDQIPHPAVTFKIELRTKYETWKDFIETLAHEMVHLYQMTVDRDIYSNHNANFYRWRNRFKSLGLRLSF
jgi:hypothetical protein